MKGSLLVMPDRNLFPVEKWSEYVNKIELLNNLLLTRKSIDRSARMIERDVNRLRNELVAAIKRGGAIERAGRIAG